MPDNIETPGFSTQPYDVSKNFYMPDTGMPQIDTLSNWQAQEKLQNFGPNTNEYNNSLSKGESISDLINDVQSLQAKGQDILNNNYTGIPNAPSPGGFDPSVSFKNLSKSLNSETPSLQVLAKPVAIGKESDLNRYKESKNFQTFGVTPNLGSEQEYKYGNAMGWGETIGKALAGGSHLAWDTFVEGWKGWGRMTDALFSWDSSKLMGTPEEREEIARKQEDIMNKYAIYDTAESKDGFWNRQFFGNMLQQSGFAVGAIGQFALEEFVTFGAATVLEPALKGAMIGRVAKSVEQVNALRRTAGIPERTTVIGRTAERLTNLFKPKSIETAGDLINANRKTMDVITKSERVTSSIVDGLKTLTPGYGTVEEMIKLNRAGAGFAQLTYTGLGGIKRGLSEFNMARSEAIFEAAGTYTQLKNRLVDDFISKNGREPNDNELEKIKQNAENASHDNFWVNMGVLAVSNRIAFDNMFKQFSKSRSILGEEMASLRGKALQVTGEVEGKTQTRVYKKGILGELGLIPEIAKTFGVKKAAWEATKGLPGLMKFEFDEGMQELIQNASDQGLENYYTDLYHGKKGYTGKLDSVVTSLKDNAFTTEGMKTFLMGALTGRLIAPISFGFTKVSENISDRNNIKKATESYNQLLNSKVKQYTTENGKAPEGDVLTKIQEEVKKSTEYTTLSQHVDDSIKSLNALYQDPTWLKNEVIANIKVNNKAAETMDIAAANHDRYVFNNTKDSALAKAVASAIKLDLYDSLRDVIKEHGVEMSDEEFQQAFGMDPNAKNKGNAKKLTDNVVKQIEDYYTTFKTLKDKYSDLIIPDLYKNNKPEDYRNAKVQKAVLDDVIEMLATNNYKAKQAIIRASGLQTELGQNKAIGGSSIEILTKLGSEPALMDHIKNLEREIKLLESPGISLTPEQKEQYKDLKEELGYANDWFENKNELINEAKVDKSYRAFANLVNLFNKRAKNYTTISKEDIEDNFLKFVDYIKLNNDNKGFIDAMNLLSSPKNMKLVYQAKLSGFYEFVKKAYEEQIEEIEKQTGVKVPEESKIDISELEVPGAEPKKTDLEKHLEAEYEKIKTALLNQGGKIPKYEFWKKTVGVVIAKKFEQNKGKPKEEAGKPKGETKKDNRAIVVNGKPAHIIETEKIDGKLYVYYQIDVPEGTNLTEEELDNLKGLFIVDPKTQKAVDKNGNIVKVDRPGQKEENKNTNKQVDEDYLRNGGAILIDGKEVESYEINNEINGEIGGLEVVFKGRETNNAISKEEYDSLKKSYIIDKNGVLYEIGKNTPSTISKKTVSTNAKASIKGSLTGQGTSIELEIVGDTGKPFLLTVDRKGNISLFSEKQPDGSYKSGNPAPKEAVINLYKKYVPSNTILKIQKWIASFTGSWASPQTEDGKNYDKAEKELIAELAALEGVKPEETSTETEIEPEFEVGDYQKVYNLAKSLSKDEADLTPESLDLMAKYNNLLEKLLEFENNRQKDLETIPKDANKINTKYDSLVDDFLKNQGKPIPKDVTGDENNVPAYAQGLDRIKKAQMQSDTMYANAEYQDGYKQIAPSNSLANATDIVKVETVSGTVTYTRNGVNTNYVFDVATKDFPTGTSIIYRVITDQADYDKMEPNRLTGEKYDKSKLFDKDGKVKQQAYDDIPIGVYSVIRGKEMLIGTVHEPLWIEYKINGKHPHIAAPEGAEIEVYVKNQVAKNRNLRKIILDNFNKNSNFVTTGVVSEKSNGILKMLNDTDLLKERVNPKIGEGGSENRHGYFAIVRNGSLQTSVNINAVNVVDTEAFTKNINQYSGVPALMLPTPTGQYMPTFIGLPKIDRDQAEFIIEAWKAFKDTSNVKNPKIVEAVYNAVGRTMSGGQPDINVLSEYLNQYYTALNHDKPLSKIGNGSDVEPGQALFDIFKDGNIKLQVKDAKTNEWVDIVIKSEKNIPANIIDLLQNLRTTIKFNDRSNNKLRGINSKEKLTFLSIDGSGKLISKDMTYNEYILSKATTYVEKGTQSENSNKDWVYFANPVVKMTINKVDPSEVNVEDIKETIPTKEDLSGEPKVDKGAALLAALKTMNATPEQVEEKKKECSTSSNLQSEINNLI